MNKKILAAAVASALAVPGLALAQSTGGVTISGVLAIGLGTEQLTNVSPLRTTTGTVAGLPEHTKATRVNDEVSILTFGIVEPLGGGMDAFGQLQFRPCLDGNSGNRTTAGVTVPTAINSWSCSAFTEQFVGIRNVKSWGQIKLGSITTAGTVAAGRGGDLTAGIASADIFASTGMMQGISVAPGAVGGTNTTVNVYAGRIPNSVQWVSPDWSGFNLRAAYSSSGTVDDSDLSSPANVAGTGVIRPGYFWTASPEYIASNWNVGGTWVTNNADGVNRNIDAQQLWGTLKFANAFRVSLVWGHIKAQTADGSINAVTGSSTIGDSNRWMITGDYNAGPHSVGIAYYRANSDKVIPGNTQAHEITVDYAYHLSNRTSVGIGYTKLVNGGNVNYPLTGANGAYLENQQIGATTSAQNFNGEGATFWGVGIKHAF